MSDEAIVAFLCAEGMDGAGRRFADILAFDDAQLERHHDYIQWLFPLHEPSRAVPGSPVLHQDSIAALRGSSAARERMHRAARRMLAFYRDTNHWRRQFDHNHLRITRIIRSLRLICGDAEADRFKAEILALAGDAPIDPTAHRFWEEA